VVGRGPERRLIIVVALIKVIPVYKKTEVQVPIIPQSNRIHKKKTRRIIHCDGNLGGTRRRRKNRKAAVKGEQKGEEKKSNSQRHLL